MQKSKQEMITLFKKAIEDKKLVLSYCRGEIFKQDLIDVGIKLATPVKARLAQSD